MNNNPQSEGNRDCSILTSYESIQKEIHQTSAPSSLQAVKLEILEKLIKEDKCPAGHNLSACCCK